MGEGVVFFSAPFFGVVSKLDKKKPNQFWIPFFALSPYRCLEIGFGQHFWLPYKTGRKTYSKKQKGLYPKAGVPKNDKNTHAYTHTHTHTVVWF